MEKLKKYCAKNGYEFGTNCGGGITIYVPLDKAEKVIKAIKRIPGVAYDAKEAWSNYPCGFKMLPVFECTVELMNVKTCKTCVNHVYELGQEDNDEFCREGINLNSIPEQKEDPSFECFSWKEEKCRYCGSDDIAYQDGEIIACNKCYAKMPNTFLEPSEG